MLQKTALYRIAPCTRHYSVYSKQYSSQYLQSSAAILVCCFRASATLYKPTSLCYNLLDTVLKNVYVAVPGVLQTKVLCVRSLSLSLCQVPVFVPLSGPSSWSCPYPGPCLCPCTCTLHYLILCSCPYLCPGSLFVLVTVSVPVLIIVPVFVLSLHLCLVPVICSCTL